MRAFRCDNCGTVLSGEGQHWFARESPAGAWTRTLEAYRVTVRVDPIGDPSGFGGMELCWDCFGTCARMAINHLERHIAGGTRE